jgi:hypothetical protein
MFGEMELGPLEEKYATAGAGVLPTTVLLAETCTVGRCLKCRIRWMRCQRRAQQLKDRTVDT